MCKDLEKIHDRYKFKEAEPCNVTIQNDEDLDRVFNQLLKSEKLIYICNRLMNEADETIERLYLSLSCIFEGII